MLTFSEILLNYINILYNQFSFDIMVFSQWWMYAPMLIPVCCYVIFFVVKWAVLTIPIWMPISMITSLFKK